ncbi:BMP3 protein, partial [Amia calva]|nr:BMP3 protein [Amia calva]
MALLRHFLLLLFGWSCIHSGFCVMLKDHLSELKRKAQSGHLVRTGVTDQPPTAREELLLQDAVSEHMRLLYEKYSSAGFHFRDGNTVRSFKAHWGTINNRQLQIFNLTTLTKSEDILSATLHYYIGDLLNNTYPRCTRPKNCGRHGRKQQAHIHLGIWSVASVDNTTRTLDHFLINVSTVYRDFISWQWKDITRVLNEAKHNDELLIGIDIASQGHNPWKKLLTVQRRAKRSASILLPLQNNELPGAEYQYNEAQTWEETNPSKHLETRPGERQRNKKKPRKNRHKVLEFDEQTLKKARKKQWNEPRNCARRYLKVDFEDIGWSEWIISPTSFDAFYCSGSCQFPMPKSLKPSNHATIQSIVRAVGVVPGIPEPCCVPERMSSLSILFLDEELNVVLKVYPNMTVESCACR